MAEDTPPPTTEKQMINLTALGEFLKSNGLASLLILLGLWGIRDVAVWLSPRIDKLFVSTEALQAKLAEQQDTILKTQESQSRVQEQVSKNSDTLLELHRSMQSVQAKDSKKISDIHKTVVKKPASEQEEE